MRILLGHDTSMERICARYGGARIELIADFPAAPLTLDETRPRSSGDFLKGETESYLTGTQSASPSDHA